jgi:hypothetical protein
MLINAQLRPSDFKEISEIVSGGWVGLGRVVSLKGVPASRWSRVRIPAVAVNFRSDLLFIARGGSTWALLDEFACLPCYPGNTLCSQRLEPPGRAGLALYKSPNVFIFSMVCITLQQNYENNSLWSSNDEKLFELPAHRTPDNNTVL